MSGANATWYAPNSTICYNNALNLIQFDFDLLMVKLMYSNLKESTLNTTMFLRNASDVSYICLDATENFYVYFMYKFKLFGYDWLNVVLGALQNALGKIFDINKIYSKIVKYDEDGDFESIYYSAGRITTMLVDYDPVLIDLEDAGFNKDDSNPDDDIYLQPEDLDAK